MQKIVKDLTLATAYKKWLDNLNKSGKDHPTYTSTNKFYKDVVANLLWVQKGLCAYTEMYLVDSKSVHPRYWKEGKFKNFEFLGHLDHYDSILKKKKGWDWNNLFVVHSDVNVKRKGQKSVHGILKPDDPKYDPFYFLEYDFKTHNFLPNSNRDPTLQMKILEDINTLGLNFKPIIDYRKEYLTPLIDDVQLGILTLLKAKQRLLKFYTAFAMSIQLLKLE
jgi:hypothetical protein